MEQFIQAARENIDRNLADAVGDDMDSIYENMYVLAHDAVVDGGGTMEQAVQIASQLVNEG